MNKKWKLVLPIVTALLLLGLLVPAVALAQTTTATRDIAEQTLEPGATTQVTVTIDVAEAEALTLDENPPAGWTLTQGSEDPAASMFKPSTSEWIWFQAAVGTITVVYDLTAPATPGSYTIAGAVVGEDWSEAVGGETAITVTGVPPEVTTATRDIAEQTLEPGATTQVTVTIDVAEAEALTLDENPPAGWTLTQGSEDPAASMFKPSTSEWIWFQAAVGTITVVYDLTAPATPGSYTIAGAVVGEDWSEAVGGETEITVSGVPPEGTTATRDIAEQTLAPGGTTQVTVTIDVAEAEALALDEAHPAGWTLTRVSEDPAASAYNANTNEWVWFQAAVGTITVVYDLTAPATPGSYTITGTISGEDWADDVDGETDIEVVPPSEEVELEFSGTLAKDERAYLTTIPEGATELDITLEATADIDLELYDGDTFVIGWKAIISSSGATTGTYQEDTFAYSGWYGGEEYITADGPLSRAYDLKVYGFRAGGYTVTVSYIPAGPPNPPPTITIDVPATVALGNPVAVTVSAADPDGVRLIWLLVYPEEYPEEWGDGYPVATIVTFADEGSLTFTPGWAETYTVEAYACDELGSCTPEAMLVTATFVVSE